MPTITITVPENRLTRLAEIAERFDLTVEELVRLSIDDLLSRPDAAFQSALEYTLDKNQELYRRLDREAFTEWLRSHIIERPD